MLSQKNKRTAVLCTALLFSPFASAIDWKAPSAKTQLINSAAALALAPVIDTMIGEGSNMLTAEGWKNLLAAIQTHIQADVFAESIDARGEAEGFTAHKGRFAAEYFKKNPVLCLMVLATMTNTGRLARNEWNRLADIEKAHGSCTSNAEGEQAKKDLVTAKADLAAATKERDALKDKLTATEKSAADLTAAKDSVAVLREELEAANKKLNELKTRDAAVPVEKARVTVNLLDGLKADAARGRVSRGTTPT